MKRTAILILAKTTDNAYKLAEKPESGKAPIMQAGMYLPKWMFKGEPKTITITIDGTEVVPA